MQTALAEAFRHKARKYYHKRSKMKNVQEIVTNGYVEAAGNALVVLVEQGPIFLLQMP